MKMVEFKHLLHLNQVDAITLGHDVSFAYVSIFFKPSNFVKYEPFSYFLHTSNLYILYLKHIYYFDCLMGNQWYANLNELNKHVIPFELPETKPHNNNNNKNKHRKAKKKVMNKMIKKILYEKKK